MSDNIKVRDEIARMTGYTYVPESSSEVHADNYLAHWVDKDGDVDAFRDHPIPNTLDEAAKLPEGWAVQIHQCKDFKGNYAWMAHAYLNNGEADCHADCPTELEARFALRLAVLKHMAAQETKQ